jgi:hypothetical protein
MIKYVKQSLISSISPSTNSPAMVESVPHLPSAPLHDPCSDISVFEDIAPSPFVSQTNLQPESVSLQGPSGSQTVPLTIAPLTPSN